MSELSRCGLIEEYPVLDHMREVIQNNHYHVGTSVWEHTLHSLAALVPLFVIPHNNRESIAFGVLLHDCCKGYGQDETHAVDGTIEAANFMEYIGADEYMDSVCVLVYFHMDKFKRPLSDNHMRDAHRALTTVGLSLSDLCMVMAADSLGRPPFTLCDRTTNYIKRARDYDQSIRHDLYRLWKGDI